MKLLSAISKFHMIIASLALAVILLVTCADVIISHVTGRPVRGVYDIVQAGLVVLIFFAIPDVFKTGSNITVDIIDDLITEFLLKLIKVFVSILCGVFIVIVGYSATLSAWSSYRYGEYLLDTGINVWVINMPVVYGLSASLIFLLLYSSALLVRLFRRGSDEEGVR